MNPTITKTILNFLAVCPWIWKMSLIKCFSIEHLLFVITGLHFMNKLLNWKIFLKGMATLRKYFTIIKKFLSEKLMTTNRCQIWMMKSNIQLSCHSLVIHLWLWVQNYFFYEMKLPPLALQANVVYLFDDSCDRNQTNIGKTERHLATSVFVEFF